MSDTKREIYIRLLRDLYEAFFSEDAIRDMLELLKEEPEQKKGKWTIKTGELAIWDVCSECKKMVIHKAPFYNYCPNCGCDMREGEQSEID